MDYYRIISTRFQETIEAIAASADILALPMARASQLLAQALVADRKILACGNGADAALAQLFAGHLLSRFEQERPALPALALAGDGAGITAIAHNISLNDIYSRQVRALGQPGDVLVCINSGAGATSLLRAVQAAHERHMGVIALTGERDAELAALLQPEDVEVGVVASRPAQVLELHTMALHGLCELLDMELFGAHHADGA